MPTKHDLILNKEKETFFLLVPQRCTNREADASPLNTEVIGASLRQLVLELAWSLFCASPKNN
jgi:hypothetical protein